MDKETAMLPWKDVRGVVAENNVDFKVFDLGESTITGNMLNDVALSNDAFVRICNDMGVPYKFFERCAAFPELRNEIFKTFAKGKVKLVVKDTKAMNVLLPDAPFIQHVKVFDALKDAGLDEAQAVMLNSDMILNFCSLQNEKAVVPGDIVRGGLTLESLVKAGEQKFRIGAYVHRLVCSNGAFTKLEHMEAVEGGNETEILDRIAGLSKKFIGIAHDELIPKFAALHDDVIKDPSALINSFLDTISLKQNVRKRVNSMVSTLYANGEPTSYDAINLVTALANDSEIDFVQRRRLQNVGGMMIKHIKCSCPVCHRVTG
jgi:hypothetical protein